MKRIRDRAGQHTNAPRDRIRATLRSTQVRPSKQRGQNFLLRPDIVAEIVAFANVPAAAHVVEIGPGTGALTRQLTWAHTLTLVELEAGFCAHLQGEFPQARVCMADARSFDFTALAGAVHVFGNIPYVFSTEIVLHLIAQRATVRSATLMVQREFAARLAAQPGGRTYGSISVAVQLWADVELGMVVPGTAFHPPTQVESQILKLTLRQEPRVPLPDPRHFERVVRAAFGQRRKKILNSMAAAGVWSRETILNALTAAQIDPGVRPEQLASEHFATLAKLLPAPGGVERSE
jgi:16S rRNA (adenine1518-N6/adenine1519-N6)-dimethyltransferase